MPEGHDSYITLVPSGPTGSKVCNHLYVLTQTCVRTHAYSCRSTSVLTQLCAYTLTLTHLCTRKRAWQCSVCVCRCLCVNM